MKSFGPKKFQMPCTDQKVPFWQFFRQGRDGRALCSPQESLTGFQTFFLLWVPIISQQCWKAKLWRAHFFKVQSGKKTVCKPSGLCNIIFVILTCFYFTNFLWYEKFSWLPSKNKVADEETEHCIDEKICEPQKVQIFISHIVFKRQPAGFFK